MNFTATADGQYFLMQVLKNDVAVQSGQVLYHASAAQPFGGMVGPLLVYCEKDDRLAISVTVSAVMAIYAARIDVWSAGI